MTQDHARRPPRKSDEATPASPPRKKKGAPYGNKYGVGGPGGGRKSKYNPSMIVTARKACQRGFVDVEIADLFGVTESTLNRWKRAYPAFARAFHLGKRQAHDRVERSLYQRAVGYSFIAEKKIMTRQGPQTLKVRQHVPPDVAACAFYLRTRRPDRWRDVQRGEHGKPGAFDHIDDPVELRRLLMQRAIELGLLPAPTVNADPAPQVGENGTAHKENKATTP